MNTFHTHTGLATPSKIDHTHSLVCRSDQFKCPCIVYITLPSSSTNWGATTWATCVHVSQLHGLCVYTCCITTTWATCVHVSPRHGLHVYMYHHDMGYMCTCITTTWATCVHVSPRHGLHVYMYHHDMGYMCTCVTTTWATCVHVYMCGGL